jgi:hypothetical protein
MTWITIAAIEFNTPELAGDLLALLLEEADDERRRRDTSADEAGEVVRVFLRDDDGLVGQGRRDRAHEGDRAREGCQQRERERERDPPPIGAGEHLAEVNVRELADQQIDTERRAEGHDHRAG